MTIHEIFQQQDWCLQVEPTQTPGKLLIVKTKAQVSTGCKWLDENLETLFKVHLPCNPQFQQSTKIPCWLDRVPISGSMFTYAQTLCCSIAMAASDPNKDKNMLIYHPFPEAPFNMCMIQRIFLPYQVQS